MRSKPDGDEIFFRYGWRAFSASGDFFLASGGPSFLATGRNNCWPSESIRFSSREQKLYANRLLEYLRAGFLIFAMGKKAFSHERTIICQRHSRFAMGHANNRLGRFEFLVTSPKSFAYRESVL